MFDLYDLEIEDDNVHEVQSQMTKLVKRFFEKHQIDALAQPPKWTDDQYSTMILHGYMRAFDFSDFGFSEFDDFWERRHRQKLTVQEQEIETEFNNLLYDLEGLYCSLNTDD